MQHSLSKAWAEYYKDCEQQPDEELAGRMEDYGQAESKMRIPRIVYETRQIKRQHEYQVSQIELQHQLNADLTDKQTELNRSFLRITVRATIAAAILGAVIGGAAQVGFQVMYQKLSPQKSQQISQPQIVSPSSASHPEKTTDKVPLSTPHKK